MSFVSVRTRGNFSPARNVRSTTAPVSRPLSFVRTNAPPFPGLTCWNSTMRQTEPSSSMCIPFLNWFVLTVSATTGASLFDGYQVLGEAREDLGTVFRDDDEVLDPDAAFTRKVDPGLDRDDVAGRERVGRFAAQSRRLVHLDADAVAEAVAELLAEAGAVDHRSGGRIGVDAARARADALQPRLLALEADSVGVLQPVGQRAGCEGAGAVGAVAVDERAGIDNHGLAGLNLTLGWPAVRERPVRAAGDDGLEGRAFRAVLVEELVQP